MWNLSRALLLAKESIYIHDWWLSPGMVGHSENHVLQLTYYRITTTTTEQRQLSTGYDSRAEGEARCQDLCDIIVNIYPWRMFRVLIT